MIFFDEASMINQSISAIDENTASECDIYDFCFRLSYLATISSKEEWNKKVLSYFLFRSQGSEYLNLEEQEQLIKGCMTHHHTIVSRHFVNIRYT